MSAALAADKSAAGGGGGGAGGGGLCKVEWDEAAGRPRVPVKVRDSESAHAGRNLVVRACHENARANADQEYAGAALGLARMVARCVRVGGMGRVEREFLIDNLVRIHFIIVMIR